MCITQGKQKDLKSSLLTSSIYFFVSLQGKKSEGRFSHKLGNNLIAFSQLPFGLLLALSSL